MLARRLATILPDMTLDEAVETTRLHRVAGLTGGSRTCVTTRPCRAPHHTIADVSVIGGGLLDRPEFRESRRAVDVERRPPPSDLRAGQALVVKLYTAASTARRGRAHCW